MFVRTLAALDMLYHGPRVILLEFGAGVVFPSLLGIFSLLKGHAVWQKPLGIYLLLIGLNYVPLLIEALRLISRPEQLQFYRDRLEREPGLGVKTTKQSLALLLPLSMPVLWLIRDGGTPPRP